MGKQAVITEIIKAETFLLTGHVNPDGDSLGCQLALAEILEQLGKTVSLQSCDAVPSMYSELPLAGRIRQVEKPEGYFDAAILIECPKLSRSGFDSIPADRLIAIDHHPDNTIKVDASWVDDTAAATAQLIFELVSDLGCKITPSIAENLYTGIVTDTGSFNYPNTTDRTLDIAAELIRGGADASAIAEKVFRSYPIEKLDLIRDLLGDMKRYHNDRVVIMMIGWRQVEEKGYSSEIFENIVNMPLVTNKVEMSALGREDKDGIWRFSVRSKGNLDVGSIARSLGGGGHKNAAGFRQSGNAEEVTRKLLAQLDGIL